jgi:hypothetical protein
MNNTFETTFRAKFDAIPVPEKLAEKQEEARARWADPAYREKHGEVSDLLMKRWCEHFLAVDSPLARNGFWQVIKFRSVKPQQRPKGLSGERHISGPKIL